MGVELVLSLRLPPLYGASILPPHKAPLEHTADHSPRRRRSVVTAEAHSNHQEGNSESRSHSSLDNCNHHHHHRHHHHHHQQQQQHQQFHHQHQQFFHQFQPHQHHQHHYYHPWQGSLDIGKQPGRLGSGFSIASECDSGEMEKQEHDQCGSSFFYNAKRSSSFSSPNKGEQITIDNVCAGGAVAGVGLPLSLRMLKRKQQELGKSTMVSGFSEVGNSLLNAFSSVVSMMKTLQSHTLRIRRQFFEQEIEGLLNQVQREMHVSFLWLFQQVFSCTPELMVLVMVLLADFTAFSMANNMPELPISLYTPPVSIISSLSNNTEIDEGFRDFFKISLKSCPSITDKADDLYHSGGSVGNGGRGVYHIAGDPDGDPNPFKCLADLNKAPYSVDDNFSTELSSTTHAIGSHGVSTTQIGFPPNDYTATADDMTEVDFSAMAAALAFQELAVADDLPTNELPLPSISDDKLDLVQAAGTEVAVNRSHPVLDLVTARSLVAPFSTQIEDDNYTCYDRTDLAYQHAITSDSNNSLLLANYAQFLFLVRKDHDRAEELFRKAVVCDPFDCDAISRFASFLWLARRNLGAAEKAYQAALQADPTNSFHAANYAHFLWSSGL